MTIQYLSDLHLEFAANSDYVANMPKQAVGEILIIAGDSIYLGEESMEKLEFWDWAADHYEQVLLIPGNHEYYHNGDVLERGDSWTRMMRRNVGFYQNRVVTIDDTDFFLTTLWSHIDPRYEEYIVYHLNDFHQIEYGGDRFTPQDFNLEHQKCLTFLKHAMEASHAKHKVVVTHHVPSRFCVDSSYRDSPMESAFTVDLTNFIIDSDIDYWIYGHSHTNIQARIGSTRVVSNQLEYVANQEPEHNGFHFESLVEI